MAAPSGAVVLTDCSGVQAFIDRTGPETLGARPDDWPPSADLLSSVGVRALRCERVTLGPFERGPVHLAFDWHNDAQAPAGCGGQPGRSASVLATLWTDDAQIAAHLRDAFGAPAFFTAFEASATPAGAGEMRTWEWGPDDGVSTLSVLTDGLRQDSDGIFRLFWPAANGVGRLALDWGMEKAIAERPAQGSLRAPMLAGDFTTLRGSVMEGVEASGEIERFGTTDCEVAA